MIRLLVIALSMVLFLEGSFVHAQAPDVEKMLAVLDLEIQQGLAQSWQRTMTEAVITGVAQSRKFQVITFLKPKGVEVTIKYPLNFKVTTLLLR